MKECNNCGQILSDEMFENEEAYECDCGQPYCEDCSMDLKTCECGSTTCSDCELLCNACDRVFCEDCDETEECTVCGTFSCEDCMSKKYPNVCLECEKEQEDNLKE